MTLWAFLFSIAYIPGWTGWAIQSGWAFISLTIPWMGWSQTSQLPRWVCWVGLLALGWALFSLLRLREPWVGIEQVWYLLCLGLVAWWASKQASLERLALGLALGLSVSTAVALAQHFGWQAIPDFGGRPAGLLYNAIIFGDACAFIILLLLAYGRYWLIAPLALGLVLSGSRGSALALVIGVVAWVAQERRWALALYALLAAPLWLVWTHTGLSDTLRLVVWHGVWNNLNWLGHGPGALEEAAIVYAGQVRIIEYAHNEPLDLAYTYGIGAILFLALLLAPLASWSRREWPAYVAFLSTALWSFPLHYPMEAAIAACCAGSLYRGWQLPWSSFSDWRLARPFRRNPPLPGLSSGLLSSRSIR